MSDGQIFILFLAGVYGFQCFFLAGRDSLAISRWWWGAFRLSGPGLALKNPYPSGLFFRLKQGDAWFNARGVFIRQGTGRLVPSFSASEPFRFFTYKSLAKISLSGRKLHLDDRLLLSCQGRPLARKILGQIIHMRETSPVRRQALARMFLDERLDSRSVEKRLAWFRSQTLWLRMICQALFLTLFLVLPALFPLAFRGPRVFLGALAAALALYLSVPALVYFAALKLYPLDLKEALLRALAALLSPLTALRAADLLAKEYFQEFHPLAVAGALLPREGFRDLARRTLLETRHTGTAGAWPVPKEIAAGFEIRLARWLKKAGLDPAGLLKAPERSSPQARAYCPCCLAQYAREKGRCVDCGCMLARF